MTAKILIGDCRKTLKELPDKSVHCVVTSPPYWGLRSYHLKEWRGGDPDCKHKGSPVCEICGAVEHELPGGIGLEPTFEEHLKNIVEVFDEVWRVLRDDGTVWLNLGDRYASSSDGVRREAGNGTDGKEQSDLMDHDFLYQNLCDECVKLLLSRRNLGTGNYPSPVLNDAVEVTNQEHKAIPDDHVANLDSSLSDVKRTSIFQDSLHLTAPSSVVVPGGQESNNLQSSLPLQDVCLPEQSLPPSSSQLKPSTLSDGDDQCVCKACGRGTVGTSPINNSSSSRKHNNLSSEAFGNYTTVNLKPKNLMLMPARIAIALQDAGWYVRSEIVWFKPNPMPEPVKDRPVSAHEKIFLLSKKPRYYYDAVGVRTPAKHSTIDRVMSEHNKSTVDNRKEYPVESKATNEPASCKSYRKRFPTKEFNGFRDREFWDNNDIGSNLRNVWQIATQGFKGAHFATFPFKLVEPCIKAGTSRGGVCGVCGAPYERVSERTLVPTAKAEKQNVVDERDHQADDNSASNNRQKDGHIPGWANHYKTIEWKPTCQCTEKSIARPVVLDPFGGSGTVAIVADYLNCDSVICEFSPEYARMAQDRIEQHMPPLFASSSVEMSTIR